MFSAIFTVIAPIFVCAAIGFVWARTRVPYETEFVTRIVTKVGMPCLVFGTLAKVDLTPEMLGNMGLAAAVTTAAFAVIGSVVLGIFKIERQVFLNCLIFANTGNMGLPVCLLAFGDPGLALGVAYFAVNGTLTNIFGPALASGNPDPRAVLKIPMVWAALGGVTVKLAGIPFPDWVLKTLDLLSGFPIPLMLITLGVSLAGLQVAHLGRSFGLAALRLVMGVAVGWAAAEVFGFEGVARGVVIIECAMPVAVFNFLYAQMYNNRPDEVAGAVVTSTMLSFATLPALLWFVI
ncbi:MAG: AEC family transporter [Rhodospirillaceae bacterium]|nr:AEC family transporter [Rhodospirillaceae bacterium]